MFAFFLSGVTAIRNALFIEKRRDLLRFTVKGRHKQFDTITVFEQEKQKNAHRMAYWEIVW